MTEASFDQRKRPVLLRFVIFAVAAIFVSSGLLVMSRLRVPSRPAAGAMVDEANEAGRFGHASKPTPIRIAKAPFSPEESTSAQPGPTNADRPPDPVQGARGALERVLADLTSSGGAQGAWVPKAQAALESLRGKPALATVAYVSSLQCFGAGCAIEFSSGEAEKAQAAVAQIDAAQDLQSWPGAHYRVGPLPAGPGQFKTHVILLRPEQ